MKYPESITYYGENYHKTCPQCSSTAEDCTTSAQSTLPPSSLQNSRGQEIKLEAPCVKCGESIGKIGVGKVPHGASLRCGGCDRFIKWVGKKELAAIEKSANLRKPDGGES